jgi:hypothetical protein
VDEHFLAGIADIVGIRFTCQKCTASLNIPTNTNSEYIPETCPYCKEPWFLKRSADLNAATWLIQALSSLRNRGKDAPCGISFELPKP